jgi:cytochrome c peroxidase
MRLTKMKLFKRKSISFAAPLLSIIVSAIMLVFALPLNVSAQIPLLDPNAVRAAAKDIGMDSLANVILTDPATLLLYVRGTPPPLAGDPTTNPPTPAVPAALQTYATSRGLSIQRAALEILGKALFWDQQTGSDGNACASCHFAAGGDNRTVNVLNPGSRNTNAAESVLWNATKSGQTGRPNYTLTAADFPFHVLADPLQTNYMNREVLFDTDDIVGSIGTFHATYGGSPAPDYTLPNATGVYDTVGAPIIDIFTVDVNPGGGVTNRNVRSNGPRQAAPTINAVFNFRNFWDGRADNTFNGINPFGLHDQTSMIKWNTGNALAQDFAAVPNSSLASQATGPIVAATSDEMVFSGRTMFDLGRKLLRLTGPGKGATATAVLTADALVPGTFNVTGITITNGGSNYQLGATVQITGGGGGGATGTVTVNGSGVITGVTLVDTDPVTAGIQSGGGYITAPVVTFQSTGLGYNAIIPLGAQQVAPDDSVLGPFKNSSGTNGGRGINLKYVNLIQWAFVPQYWDGTGPADPVTGLPTMLTTAEGFSLMENNMGLFWGLAIQAYETLLRADQTPYDMFMSGNNGAFDPAGYAGTPGSSPAAQDVMKGLLTYIHTENTKQQVNPIFNNINFGACQLCHSGPELTENSLVNVPAKFFVATDMTVNFDHNRELAIVPSTSNFDVGFTNISTRPSREDVGLGATVLGGLPLSLTRAGQQGFIFGLPALSPAQPNIMRGSNIDGAFKIPSLRNIEMSGPYFHNGGELTLKQVVEFYARHGDFADTNDPNVDVGQAMVQNLTDHDIDLLVKFLLTLTDERVRNESGFFDHPQLFIPNGHAQGATNPTIAANTTSLGSAFAQDTFLVLPAVGKTGRSTLPAGAYPAGNSPVPNFMGISATPIAGPNNDHFDP